MRRFLTILLSCALLLGASSFATSRNRFETRRFLTPHTPAQPTAAQVQAPVSAKAAKGKKSKGKAANQSVGKFPAFPAR